MSHPSASEHDRSANAEPLHLRWLGKIGYAEALDLQQQMVGGTADHLLLLEHPPVYTLGVRTKPEHLLVDPTHYGAEVVEANRGGDVTFHGPGGSSATRS
ncbi:MAG: hypothetical protein R2710_11285 [Acidimicrobiales bacterium]